ncbi:MAG: late competence development ComFB family protein [Microcystaceae cyanobacterium]
MQIPDNSVAKIHVNVMESLVYAEIEKQLKFYPKNLKGYINKIEVATYALNRLPALYASSKQGEEQQRRLALKKHKELMGSVVRRAIAAIERDPLRSSEPIISDLEIESEESKQSLKRVQFLLKDRGLLDYDTQTLTWENLPNLIQRALNKLEWIQPNKAEELPPPLPVSPPSPPSYGLDRGTLW